MYSLEDDDCSELFITQSTNDSIMDEMELSQRPSVLNIFGSDGTDFQSPCTLLVNRNKPIYEDISDDDFDNSKGWVNLLLMVFHYYTC